MTDKSKREELIEEAAEELKKFGYARPGYWQSIASTALAVFEQAHTPTECLDCGRTDGGCDRIMDAPTDDEREGLADRLFAFAQRASVSDLKNGRTDALLAAVAVLRRTAVQEPSTEPSEAQVVAALDAYDDARTNNLAERGDAMHAALRAAADAGQEEKR